MTVNRREFIQQGTAHLSALAAFSITHQAFSACPKASETVVLGRSNIRASRLGFGVGNGKFGQEQPMEQAEFTRLIRHALDRGICYFDMATGPVHCMMEKSLQGVDRSQYAIVTQTGRPKTQEEIDTMIPRYLKEFNTPYIDGILITSVGKENWREEYAALRDMLSHAKEKGWIRAHGASVHGMEALQSFPQDEWLDLILVSMNHQGHYMDAPAGMEATPEQRRDLSVPVIRKIYEAGIGVTSMKTFAASGFGNADERRKSLRFIKEAGCVHTMPINFKNTAELDEVIALVEST